MNQFMNHQLARERHRRFEPVGVRRRSLRVAMLGRRVEQQRLHG